MDHRSFLSSLDPADRQRLTAQDARAGWRQLALHLALIVAPGLWIGLRLPLWPLALPLLGLALTFLFAAAHECTHGTALSPRWLNEAVGHFAGLVLLLPFLSFRYYHLAHHRHTNDPERDPELEGATTPATPAEWILYLSGLPFWRAQAKLILTAALGRPMPSWAPPGVVPRLRTEARIYLGVYALALLSLIWSPLVLWLWLVPVLIGQPVLRLYLLAEHGDCPRVADMFLNTRTTFTNRAVRLLAWNMPYHAEHHVYPAVPFHRLPELHALTQAHLGQTAEGYAAFTRAYLARHGAAPGRRPRAG